MDQSHNNTTEVLIVGAGPTGLMMACQLAMHQVSFRIIDKNITSSQNSGALIVQARTLEIFEQMGIADEAISQGIVADRVSILYNGKKIAFTSIKNIGRNLSQFPFLLMLEQSNTEKLLLKFIRTRGHSVERGVQFKSFVQDKDGTTTTVVMPDASDQIIKSKYIIAADGSNSSIRNFLGIPFKGKTYSKPIFILDCEAISELSPGVISFAFSRSSVAGFFPLQHGRWRVDGTFPKRLKKSKTIPIETITDGFRYWNNLNFTIHNTEWFSVSRSHQKYARTIRVGNCFLAGDSAHVHTPVGAQGMNTGLQDAHNLAWKMAFVLRQNAKPELLDTYSTDRVGVSRGFAHYSDAVFKFATRTNIVTKLFRTFMLKVFFKKIFPKFENNEKSRLKFFESISQIGIQYKPGFHSDKNSIGQFLQSAPKPGHRFPYIDFVQNNKDTNSHKIIDNTGFTLLVLAEEFTTEIKIIAQKYSLKLILIKHLPETGKIYARLGITKTGFYLIRPDMYIELRSSTSETENLSRYLQLMLIVHQEIKLRPKSEKHQLATGGFV